MPNARWELTQRMHLYGSLILQLVLQCLALLVALCKIACRTILCATVGHVCWWCCQPHISIHDRVFSPCWIDILTGCSDSFISLMSVIPQELVGEKEAANAFGVLSFTSAIIGAIGWPAGGSYLIVMHIVV